MMLLLLELVVMIMMMMMTKDIKRSGDRKFIEAYTFAQNYQK